MIKRSARIDRAVAFPDRILADLVGQSRITEADVTALRSSDLSFGIRSREEAEMMLAIERANSEKCRAWGEFLVECLMDFVVWDQRPSGILTEAAAHWLSDQVGETPTPACLALLVAIVDEAHTVPAWFIPAICVRAAKVFGRHESELSQRAA